MIFILFTPDSPHRELLSVPDDLRNVLEQCLAEDATPDNLDLYLPNVRQIITNLLQGLRGKQSIYRRIVSDHRHRSGDQNHRADSRASRSTNGSTRGERHHSSQSSRPQTDDERESGSVSRRSGQSSRRRDQVSGQSQSSYQQSGNSNFVGGFAQTIAEHPVDEDSSNTQPSQSNDKAESQRGSDVASNDASSSRTSTPSQIAKETLSSSSNHVLSAGQEQDNQQPIPSPPMSAVPASVKRYSLVDKPASPTPVVVVDPSSPMLDQTRAPSPPPPSETPPVDPPPAVALSLALLKSNDVILERRASKRFSVYNISKMTGASTSRERSIRGNNNHVNRRSVVASPANLTPNDLAVLTEDDEEAAESPKELTSSSRRQRSGSRSVILDTDLPQVTDLPTTPEPIHDVGESSSSQRRRLPSSDSSQITVFLQLGREVKKVKIEPGLTFSSLRVLFVDKFSYNPGLENFPAIYIRDPSSGVQYELENTDEVQEKCLLSLNIERTYFLFISFVITLTYIFVALDQIKQHIDSQISSLSSDIKELRTAVANSHRHSTNVPDIIAHPLAESTPVPARPSDHQFQHIARRLSRFVGDSGPSFMSQSQPSPIPAITSQMTGQSLQTHMTGGSVLSDYTSRVVTDLKTQFDEVQNLRRDLGIMRQLYTEFMKSTKESLGTLRTQTQSVKQLANSNIGGARAYIDSGKKTLDNRTQDVLTKVEMLQDRIENVKDDVVKRQVTPEAVYVKMMKKDLDEVIAELKSLTEHVVTVKPMWKKTWEEELQNIVEEQQFLTHQEELLGDLLEDHKAMMDVFGHVMKVITLRKPNNGTRRSGRTYKPPPLEEGHEGLGTVMRELRNATLDPEKRLKAIEASQKIREKELASRSDGLHVEITEFVSQKKLRMTGGAEEIERVRQKRSDMTLKAMFTGGSSNGSLTSFSTDLATS